MKNKINMRSSPGDSMILNHYAHGYALFPILNCLVERNVFAEIRQHRKISLPELAKKCNANEGYLRIALHVAQGCGLVVENEGKISLEHEDSISSELINLSGQCNYLYEIDPIDYLRFTREQKWTSVIQQIKCRWNTSSSEWAKEFADGVVIIPLLVGFYQIAGSNAVTKDKISLENISPVAKDEIVTLFELLGWSNGEFDNKLMLTDIGSWVFNNALNYSLGLSYRKLLHRIEDLIFGEPLAVFERTTHTEEHVDRTLNVLSSGSMHKNYFKSVSDVVLQLFRDRLVEDQPSYIVDTGCGDGTLLAELYERICRDSSRGTQIDRHPLLMVGVDFNNESLSATGRLLTEKGVPHLTLHGDIGDPNSIKESLVKAGINSSRKILHVRSFLDHDRPYLLSKGNQISNNILEGGLFTTRSGLVIPNDEVMQSLVEHFQRWRGILAVGDELMILEVHSLSATESFRRKGNCISLHFDPLQALTGQLLVSAKAFFYATAASGLYTTTLKRFPEHEAFSRITFQNLKSVGYQIRYAIHRDLPELSAMAMDYLDLNEATVNQLISDRLNNAPQGQFVITTNTNRGEELICAVAYVNRNDDITPFSIELENAQDVLGASTLHIVDVHVIKGEVSEWRRILIEYLTELMLLDETFERLIYVSNSSFSADALSQDKIIQNFIDSSDPDLIHVNGVCCQPVSCLAISPRRIKLALAFQRHRSEKELKALQMSPPTAFALIKSALSEVTTNSSIDLCSSTSLFDLGVDSLEIARFVSLINKHLPNKVSISDVFRNSQFEKLALLITERSGALDAQSNHEGKTDLISYPLSLSQEPMWIWFELAGDTGSYNVPRIERFCGKFRVDLFTNAVSHVVSRHDILRTRYSVTGGVVIQTILPMKEFRIPLNVLRLNCVSKDNSELANIVSQEINNPIDLRNGETFRILILELNNDEWILLITMHHMVTDGGSIPLFWNELSSSYKAYLENSYPSLPKILHAQYHDWGLWQREQLESGAMDTSLEYWKKTLLEGKPLPILELPIDHPYPLQQTSNGNRLSIVLASAVCKELKKVAIASKATLFAAITASWGVFLTKLCRQDEIVIATPWANREHVMAEHLIGCFVNTMPLRLKISEGISFSELVSNVRDTTLSAMEHAAVPFHKIVEKLKIHNIEGRLPVYQTMVALEEESGWIRGESLAGTTRVENSEIPISVRGTSKFEISLSIREMQGKDGAPELQGELVYNTDIFDLNTAQLLRDRFVHTITTLATLPHLKLENIDFIPQQEKDILLYRCNSTYAEWSDHESILGMIESRFLEIPGAIAIYFEQESITYEALQKQMLSTANYLKHKGISRGQRVGVLLDRTPKLLISILALIKLGATYVPIDINTPEERLNFICNDAGITFLLVDQSVKNNVSTIIQIIPITSESIPENYIYECLELGLDNDAYILYTSGTTGKPKGARISHSSLLNDVQHIIHRQIQKDVLSRTLWSTSIAFDQSVEEMFPALCSGGSVVLVENLLDPNWFDRQITLIVTTPSLFSLLLSRGVPPSVRGLVLGGESVSQSLINRIFQETCIETIYNSYGPTECTDQATVCVLTRSEKRVSIGRPISNVQVYILDEQKKIVPYGVFGELYIGGAGVSRGYINRDQLNLERFLPNPFGAGVIYRTGDKVRWNSSQNLEYEGRLDDQLKINGVRIEPGEVEALFYAESEVTSVFVTSEKNYRNEECLVAYVVPESIDVKSLMARCRRSLPTSLVPTSIIPITKLPVTISGKIDRASLPSAWPTRHKHNNVVKVDVSTEQSNVSNRLYIELFQEVLQYDKVQGNTSFFQSGGHSLLAVELLGKLQERHGIKIKMRDFFLNDTPNGLLESFEFCAPAAIDNTNKILLDLDQYSYEDIPPGGSSIVIIGVGVAGIMAAIECKKRGVPFVIVDKAKNIGGIWFNGCNEESRLQTTSAVYKLDSNFDFSSTYPDRREVIEHLGTLMDHYKLWSNLKLNTEVINIERSQQFTFQLTTQNGASGNIERIDSDGVLVCTGKHHRPFVPSWKPRDGQPRTVHASRLDGVPMHDLNVVIVGGGSFAIEALRIAHQRNAAHIHLVERHSYWVLPTFADTILHDGIIRPSLNFSDDFQARTMQLEKWLIDYYRQQNLEHLIPTKENRAFDVRVSTSDEFFKLLQQQNIEAHIGEIAETYYGGVKLHDDRIIKADLIIAATGYCDPEFEFLSNIAPEGVQVYQGWMLSKDPRIAFVGFLDMLTSSTAVIPLNLELAFRSMQDVSYRPKLNRVTRWIDKMPVDLLSNVKSHYSWLNEEKQFLDAEAIKHKASGSNCFLDSLNDFARLNSHSTAVVCENVSLSYGELNLRANIFASFLKDKKIKSVIACLPHCAESLVVTLGFLKSGIDAILFDVKSSEDFLSIFRAEQFDAVCIDVSFVDLLKQPITMGNYDQCVTIVLGSSNGADLGNVFEIDELIDIKTEESLAEEYTDTDTDTDTDADAKHSSHLTFYTSGTTGCAKGVRHSLISLQEAVIGFEQTLFSANLSKESRLILINRVTHLGGFMAAFSVLSNGGTLFLKQGFRSAEMIETISLHKPTHLVMFTAWLSDLVEDEKFQHSTLNSVCVVIGGESIPTGLYRNLCRESSVKLVGTFGISECGPLFLKTYNAESINDCGDPLPGVEFKIMRDKVSNDRGVGELWVKSRSMFQCYRGDPQRTSDNLNSQAWFKTGDMVSLNESGHVVIHGRAKDRISPNFFIQDIEYAILEYPSIRQVCAGWCELENNQLALKINIVLASNVKSIPENELKQKLYSVFPMLINDLKFEIVRELLRNRNGKIVRPIIERIEQKKIRSHKLKNYRVIMFPGQGSQHIGMLDGFDGISEFKELIEFSEDFCGKRFTDICSNGPEVLLTKTNVCQVSVFLASYFELRMAMQRDSGFIERCEYMLGLSLGEYTALVATGALSDEDAIRLLHVRGNAMRNASSRDNQKMVSINGLSLEQMQLLNNLVQYENSVFLANDLTDNHIVIAGDESGCKKVLKFAEKEGARCTILPVEGAFHTKYMSAVGSELENVLQTIELSKPCVPIICNVDALPSNNIIQLRSNLIKQVDHPVLFKQSLLFLHKETIVPSEIYTCGPGSILENIVHEAWNSFEIASINVL